MLVMKTSWRRQPMWSRRFVEQLARRPDERPAGGVLGGAGALADEEDVAQDVALTGNGAGSARGERALRAAANLARDLGEQPLRAHGWRVPRRREPAAAPSA